MKIILILFIYKILNLRYRNVIFVSIKIHIYTLTIFLRYIYYNIDSRDDQTIFDNIFTKYIIYTYLSNIKKYMYLCLT